MSPVTPLKLDLGGVGKSDTGYLTVNLYPWARSDFWADVTTLRGTGVRDGSVDEIYLSHTFEHIDLAKIETSLACWRRKLKPGGTLRIKGPNIEFYFDLLRRGAITDEIFIHILFGHYPRNVTQPLMSHKWGWRKDFLAETLRRNGFTDIAEYEVDG